MYLHYINASEDVNPLITNLHFLNEFIHIVYLDDIWMYIYKKRSGAEAGTILPGALQMQGQGRQGEPAQGSERGRPVWEQSPVRPWIQGLCPDGAEE